MEQKKRKIIFGGQKAHIEHTAQEESEVVAGWRGV